MNEGQVYHGRATTLRRVVPICQKQRSNGLTFALTSLEVYAGGNGVLRYLLEKDGSARAEFVSVPYPELTVTDASGRELWTSFSGGRSRFPIRDD